MDLETIYYIGQTIAAAAILISLIFVGIQMRDGNRLARAQMHQEISDSFIQMVLALPDRNDAFYEAWFSKETYKTLGRSDTELVNGILLGLWRHFENVYYQHKSGFVEDTYFQSTTQFMSLFLAREGVQFWWEGRKAVFAPEFVAFVETLKTPAMPIDMKAILRGQPASDAEDANADATREEPEA